MKEISNYDVEMLQVYPMRMNIRAFDIQGECCRFQASFSKGDFFRESAAFIPISFFLELLGQSAECFFRLIDNKCKRYLVQVNHFKFDIELFQKMDLNFMVQINITQKFGKLYKSHITLSQEKRIYCEGDYIHCNA